MLDGFSLFYGKAGLLFKILKYDKTPTPVKMI